MRCAIAILLCALGWSVASAADLGPTHQIVTTTNALSAVTASTTNSFEDTLSYHHTFNVVDSTGGTTNLASVIIDRGLDNANWVSFFTNSATSSGTVETNFTGAWAYYRVRLVVTNALSTITVSYLGTK